MNCFICGADLSKKDHYIRDASEKHAAALSFNGDANMSDDQLRSLNVVHYCEKHHAVIDSIPDDAIMV